MTIAYASSSRKVDDITLPVIATLRHLIIRVPGRLVTHAGRLTLRLPPGRQLLAEILARLRALPAAT